MSVRPRPYWKAVERHVFSTATLLKKKAAKKEGELVEAAFFGLCVRIYFSPLEAVRSCPLCGPFGRLYADFCGTNMP